MSVSNNPVQISHNSWPIVRKVEVSFFLIELNSKTILEGSNILSNFTVIKQKDLNYLASYRRNVLKQTAGGRFVWAEAKILMNLVEWLLSAY